MNIEIENEVDYRFDFDVEKVITDVVNEALDYEEFPYECMIDIVITDNAGIREINKEFREIDRETDVLSFPMIPFEEPAGYDVIDEEDDGLFDPESGELVLGSMMISAEKAAAQAEEYGHSLLREIAFLTAHSMLHLMGYDHMEDEERVIMEKRQEEILQKLHIER